MNWDDAHCHLLPLKDPDDWRSIAACKGADAAIFFDDKERNLAMFNEVGLWYNACIGPCEFRMFHVDREGDLREWFRVVQ